jgi:hypothetical protein
MEVTLPKYVRLYQIRGSFGRAVRSGMASRRQPIKWNLLRPALLRVSPTCVERGAVSRSQKRLPHLIEASANISLPYLRRLKPRTLSLKFRFTEIRKCHKSSETRLHLLGRWLLPTPWPTNWSRSPNQMLLKPDTSSGLAKMR